MCVHNIAPGIALTALQMAGKWADLNTLRLMNLLAETPETIADSLVPRIRRVAASGQSGTTIRYLTQGSILWRCVTAAWRVNRWFDIWNGGAPAFNATKLIAESKGKGCGVAGNGGDREEEDGPPRKRANV